MKSRQDTVLVGILLVMFSTSAQSFTCDESAVWCETSLVIEQHLTMFHSVYGAVYPANGKLWKFDVTNTSEATPIDPREIITADGFEKQHVVVVANGSMPGPDIIVYEGQMLRVYVHNKLQSETVSIHWHGIPQKGSPYMDGAAFITQCPILPGEIFKYEFRASPKGTYWYHSHVGNQHVKGSFGALIIRQREMNPLDEHIIQIQDWSHVSDPDLVYFQMRSGIFINRRQYGPSVTLDGHLLTPFYANDGLINGRGRTVDVQTGKDNGAPLEKYIVEYGKSYRFRVIAVGMIYAFRLSVDGHQLSVVASDGHDVKPVTVESIIIYPGERFDFILVANQTTSNYWIRGKTLEINRDTVVKAILRYSGAPKEDPTTTKQNCNENKVCVVLNCPFPYYPKNEYTQCLPLDHLRSGRDNDPAPAPTDGKFQELFLNFVLPQIISTINGVRFVYPTVSGISQPTQINARCENENCSGENVCSCTHSLDIHKDYTVQMVFHNHGAGSLTSHPIHLHGHPFYVLKMGFGKYNETTGKYISPNPDIYCPGGPSAICRDATWRNTSWANGNIPGLELQNPILKDTVILPVGGYVVVRFKADNPGLWLLHCHIQIHISDGMSILLNESFSEIPDVPEGFPVCGPRPQSLTSTQETTTPIQQITTQRHILMEGQVTKTTLWIIVGILAGVCLILFAAILTVCTRRQRVLKVT